MDSFHSGRPTFAEISLSNLVQNFNSCRSFVGKQTKIMSVVKADAYGHGAVACSRALEAEGCDWFGVALVDEGVELRAAGISSAILVLGGCWPDEAREVLAQSLTPVVYRMDSAEALSRAALERGIKVDVHLKIDTGMGRLGVPLGGLSEFAGKLRQLDGLNVVGAMTHFAVADDLSQSVFTNRQITDFDAGCRILTDVGYELKIRDIANSPGAVAHPAARLGLVRLGGVLYGLGDDVLPNDVPKPDLRPVMSLHSEVALLKTVQTGTTIGYSRTFSASRETIVATVPIGYHDGYPRALSGRSYVLLNGQRAPVIGRVSMDWITIDVTDIPGTELGTPVVVCGSQGDEEIRASELAGLAGTISYEITCGVSSRVPRRIIEP